MLRHGPRCSPPHRCTSPRRRRSPARSKGCGHSGSHTCSTPHPQAGLATATDTFSLPQIYTRIRVHKDKVGLNRDRGWYPWTHKRRRGLERGGTTGSRETGFSELSSERVPAFPFSRARCALELVGSPYRQEEGASHLPVGSSPSSLRQRRRGGGSPCTSHGKSTGASAKTTRFTGLRRNEGRSMDRE